MVAMVSVVWCEIHVNDLRRAQSFYEIVLGVKLEELPSPPSVTEAMEMLMFPGDMDGMGAGGSLIKVEGVKAGVGGTIVYFGSEDCAVEESRIEKAGGKVLESKQSLGEYGFMVVAFDTEGNKFGLHSLK